MKVKINDSKVLKLLDNAKIEGEKIMAEALLVFKKATPVRGGNARRNTRLKNKTTIIADYAYAGKLDKGYSKQAPKGMVAPTVDYIKKTVLPNSIRRLNRG